MLLQIQQTNSTWLIVTARLVRHLAGCALAIQSEIARSLHSEILQQSTYERDKISQHHAKQQTTSDQEAMLGLLTIQSRSFPRLFCPLKPFVCASPAMALVLGVAAPRRANCNSYLTVALLLMEL